MRASPQKPPVHGLHSWSVQSHIQGSLLQVVTFFVTDWSPPRCSYSFWISQYIFFNLLFIQSSALKLSGQDGLDQVPRGQKMLPRSPEQAFSSKHSLIWYVSVHASNYLGVSFVADAVFIDVTTVLTCPQPQIQWTSIAGRRQPFLTSPEVLSLTPGLWVGV